MKIILLEDVKTVGKKGEIVEVSDAYGRNVLLRGKKGVEATSRNLNDLKLQRANDEKVAAENLAFAKEFAKKLDVAQVTVKVKVGEGGKVFGSVSSKEIAEEAKKQLGYDLDKKKIQLSAPLKAIGTSKVPVKLHPQVTAQLTVHVVEA